MNKSFFIIFALAILFPITVMAEGMAEFGVKAAVTGNSEMVDMALEDAYFYGSASGLTIDQPLGNRKITPSYGLNPYFDLKFISDKAFGGFLGLGADIGSQDSEATAFSAPLNPGYFSYSSQTFSTTETNFRLYFGPSFVIDRKFYILPSVGYIYHQVQGTNRIVDYWENSRVGVGALQLNDNTMKGKAKGTTLGLDLRYKLSRLFEIYGGYTYNYSVSGFMNWDEMSGPSSSSSGSSSGSGGGSSSSIAPQNMLGIWNARIGSQVFSFVTIPIMSSSGYIMKGGTYSYGVRYNISRYSYIRMGIESERTFVKYDGYSKIQYGLGGYFYTILDDDLLSDYLIYNKQRRRFSDAIVFAIGASF